MTKSLHRTSACSGCGVRVWRRGQETGSSCYGPHRYCVMLTWISRTLAWVGQAAQKEQEWPGAGTIHETVFVLTQSCPTLWDSVDCGPPGFSVHGFSRQQYWSGLSFPPSGDRPNPGIEPRFLMSPALATGFFTTSTSWEALVFA